MDKSREFLFLDPIDSPFGLPGKFKQSNNQNGHQYDETDTKFHPV
jgi:hypothetical protein